MRSSLLFQGGTICDLKQNEIGDGGLWVELNDFKLEHLDPDVRHNLEISKSL